ncbi:DUF4823 domain-containing protein [Ketobacter sp. MCCC 1A13808]|nr:DUF4823 domain-containing protein [Ketobacter sp. MCCC 1A13808]RLP56092.1 MAG: DUF4823 domain-containing protein [Ketobacter sp.]
MHLKGRVQLKFIRLLILGSAFCAVVACSSDSHVAKSSTDLFGAYSPVGSRDVIRKHQTTLASRYRIHIGYAPGGMSVAESADLNRLQRDALANQISRYFIEVSVSDTPQSLSHSLNQALDNNAQILLYPRITKWPDIEPIGSRNCKNEPQATKNCDSDSNENSSNDEMGVMIAIYDVLSRRQLDTISARSRRGASSYLYKDNLKELGLLNQLIVSKLVPN